MAPTAPDAPAPLAPPDTDAARILMLLERMDARLSRLEATVDEVRHQAPAVVAGVTDTVDHFVAQAQDRGVDVHAHLHGSLRLAEALTEPRTVATLSRLVDRLDLVDQALALAAEVPALTAGAMDTVDGLVARGQARGIDVDARVQGTLKLVEAATRPESLVALETLVARLEQLAPMLDLVNSAPDAIAGAFDTLDGIAARLAERGIRVDERMHLLVQAVEKLTDPVIVGLLHTVLERGDDLSRAVDVLLASGIFDEAAVQVVGSSGRALVQTRAANPPPVGAWGAMTSMSDPDVQRALGFAIQFARSFGKTLPARS